MTPRTIICRAAALILAVFVCLVALRAPVAAESALKQRGQVTFEASWYPRSAAFDGQKNSFFHVELQPELSFFDDTTEWVLKPRISGGTVGVGLVDFREAHVTSRIGEIDVLVGNTILFWGKVESYNPVDIVNSLDYSRGLMRGEKLGAPMAQVSLPIGSSQLDLLAIDFVKNIYPGQALRERVGTRFGEQIIFSGGGSKNDIGQAARWSAYFGGVDLGLSWFRGIGNAPRLTAQSNGTLRPDYSRINQMALDIQYLWGDTAFKGELINRKGQYDRLGAFQKYRAGVLGLEHSFYDIANSGNDLILLTEYAFDSRNSLSHSGFQNDLTIGTRWLKNDIDDTEVAALLTQDLDYKAQLITIRMDRRINDSVTFKTSVRLPSGFHRDPNSSVLAKDAAIIAALTFRY
jgi:hypothetical protein